MTSEDPSLSERRKRFELARAAFAAMHALHLKLHEVHEEMHRCHEAFDRSQYKDLALGRKVVELELQCAEIHRKLGDELHTFGSNLPDARPIARPGAPPPGEPGTRGT